MLKPFIRFKLVRCMQVATGGAEVLRACGGVHGSGGHSGGSVGRPRYALCSFS